MFIMLSFWISSRGTSLGPRSYLSSLNLFSIIPTVIGFLIALIFLEIISYSRLRHNLLIAPGSWGFSDISTAFLDLPVYIKLGRFLGATGGDFLTSSFFVDISDLIFNQLNLSCKYFSIVSILELNSSFFFFCLLLLLFAGLLPLDLSNIFSLSFSLLYSVFFGRGFKGLESFLDLYD